MSVNVQNLEKILTLRMKSSMTSEQALIYSKAIQSLKTGTINVVQTIYDLPVASNSNLGELVLVKNEGMVYFNDSYMFLPIKTTSRNLIFSWGYGVNGQIGDGTSLTKSSPVSVVGGFTDWCQVGAGYAHTAAVRTNGTLWAWGSNTCGQLGDSTTVDKSSPVSVVGGFTDWCQVGAGKMHTAAIRSNGTIWTWGNNLNGKLGDNTIVSKSSPVSVVGGFTDWCQVSTGSYHTAAVRKNGTLWTWGFNGCGRLGDNTAIDKSSPVSVVGGFTNWCHVSAGNAHTAAIRTNGTLWAWGCNIYSQLGDNTTVSKSSPVSVVGGFTDWCKVAAGNRHTAAVRTNGTLWTWGCNSNGQLGDNTIIYKSSPVSVVGGFTDWCQVFTCTHTVAVRTNGTLWGWGSNACGKLGDNTIANKSSPVSVVGGFTDWSLVSGGYKHTIALRKRTF